MAQVIVALQKRVDFLLDYLSDSWRELPRVEGEIDNWDTIEQVDYVEEWGPKEALLDELRRYASDGQMTEEQRGRYSQLEHFIAEHRRILTRLRES